MTLFYILIGLSIFFTLLMAATRGYYNRKAK
jgi:hypothetical protein